jgi:hypothetical protein
MFVIGSVAAGIGVSAGAAGAGVNGNGDKNCKIPFEFTPREATAEFQFQPPTHKPAHCEELEVTKVVTGTPQPAPPPGTQFSVVVECLPHQNDNNNNVQDDIVASSQFMDWQDWVDSLPEGNKPPFTTTLTFGPEGGTESILVAAKHESDCTVTEEPPAGCTLTSIDPETTRIGGHADAEAARVREPVVHSVTVTNNCDPAVQPAAATASAVVVQPTFTG